MNCKDCGACCEMLYFVIPRIKNHEVAALYTFYKARGCKISFNRGEGGFEYAEIFVPAVCPQLTLDKKCSIHDFKPMVCKNFKIDCEMCKKCRKIKEIDKKV